MKWRSVFIFLALLVLMSCKKDKLKGDKEIFIGTWNWLYTGATLSNCDGMPYNTELNPITESCEYSISFEKRGKVFFYKNENLTSDRRIVFKAFGKDYYSCGGDYIGFEIKLDNYDGTDIKNIIGGCINSDTLIIHNGFPYYNDGCNFYLNYFKKN